MKNLVKMADEVKQETFSTPLGVLETPQREEEDPATLRALRADLVRGTESGVTSLFLEWCLRERSLGGPFTAAILGQREPLHRALLKSFMVDDESLYNGFSFRQLVENNRKNGRGLRVLAANQATAVLVLETLDTAPPVPGTSRLGVRNCEVFIVGDRISPVWVDRGRLDRDPRDWLGQTESGDREIVQRFQSFAGGIACVLQAPVPRALAEKPQDWHGSKLVVFRNDGVKVESPVCDQVGAVYSVLPDSIRFQAFRGNQEGFFDFNGGQFIESIAPRPEVNKTF